MQAVVSLPALGTPRDFNGAFQWVRIQVPYVWQRGFLNYGFSPRFSELVKRVALSS